MQHCDDSSNQALIEKLQKIIVLNETDFPEITSLYTHVLEILKGDGWSGLLKLVEDNFTINEYDRFVQTYSNNSDLQNFISSLNNNNNYLEEFKKIFVVEEKTLKRFPELYCEAFASFSDEGVKGLVNFLRKTIPKNQAENLIKVVSENENLKNLMNKMKKPQNCEHQLENLKTMVVFEEDIVKENPEIYEQLLGNLKVKGFQALEDLASEFFVVKKYEIFIEKHKSNENFMKYIQDLQNLPFVSEKSSSFQKKNDFLERIKKALIFDKDFLQKNKLAYVQAFEAIIKGGKTGIVDFLEENFTENEIFVLLGGANIESNQDLNQIIQEIKQEEYLKELEQIIPLEEDIKKKNPTIYFQLFENFKNEPNINALLSFAKTNFTKKKADSFINLYSENKKLIDFLKKINQELKVTQPIANFEAPNKKNQELILKSQEELKLDLPYENVKSQSKSNFPSEKNEGFQNPIKKTEILEENIQHQKKDYTQINEAFLTLLDPKENKITKEDFCKLTKEMWGDVERNMSEWMVNKNKRNSTLFPILFPNIIRRLSTGEDFSTICQHKAFTSDEDSSLYGFNQKCFLIFLFESFPDFNFRLANLYSKIPGKPIPFLYFSPLSNSLKINLKAFSQILAADRPSLISLGDGNIGKSHLLNLVFFTDFEENNDSVVHTSVDTVFSTEEFQIGMNIFDLQSDFLKNQSYFLPFLNIYGDNAWIILQVSAQNKNWFQDLEEIISILKIKVSIFESQLLIFIRDWTAKKKDNAINENFQKKINILKINEERVFYVPISKNDDNFKSKINELRRNLYFNFFGKTKNRKKPIDTGLISSTENNYWKERNFN